MTDEFMARDPAVCVCGYRLVCETGASWEQTSDRVTVSVAGNAVGVSKDIFSLWYVQVFCSLVDFHFTPSE